MGLRDAWQAAKVEMGAVPVDIDELGDDLRDCVERIHPKDRNSFLGGFNAWGPALKLQDDEVCLAASPVVMDGRGILILTDRRLFQADTDGYLELPLHELSIGRIGQNRIGTLIVQPAHDDRRFEFGLSPYKRETRDQFCSTLEDVVRRHEQERVAGSGDAGGQSPADELAKFAALHDQGVITEEEFERKKQELLK
jgi:hypothetical protein